MEAPFSADFFKRLQQLKIHTRKSFLGKRQGSHLSSRKGHGLEFSDHRLYSPGDDFRHIDWGILGRTDRLYVKQFREEQDLNVLVLLDASASMAHPKEKFELASDLALALGFVALSDGDTVNFTLLGQERTPTYNGPRAIGPAYKKIKSASAKGKFDLQREVGLSISKTKAPGKCFLISDFLMPTEELIKALKVALSKNFELALVQVLAPEELDLNLVEESSLLIDSETGAQLDLSIGKETKKAYARALADHIQEIETFAKKSGISYLLVSSEESLKDIIIKKMPSKGFIS